MNEATPLLDRCAPARTAGIPAARCRSIRSDYYIANGYIANGRSTVLLLGW